MKKTWYLALGISALAVLFWTLTTTTPVPAQVGPAIPTPAAALTPFTPRPTPTPHATPVTVPVPAVSRAQIIGKVRALTPGEFSRIDRVEAKLVTWDELKAAEGSHPAIKGRNPDDLVWAVAASGDYEAPLAVGKHYPWAIIYFNPLTGRPLGSFADVQGTWPPYFDRLPDRDPTR